MVTFTTHYYVTLHVVLIMEIYYYKKKLPSLRFHHKYAGELYTYVALMI